MNYDKTGHTIQTPFNIENILRACPELLKAWKRKPFILKYNTELQLITIRHYNENLVKQHTSGKKIFLEQKSRTTVQLLVR